MIKTALGLLRARNAQSATALSNQRISKAVRGLPGQTRINEEGAGVMAGGNEMTPEEGRAFPEAERIVHLAGVTIGGAEPDADTMVFHLRTQSGDELELDMHMLLLALGFGIGEEVIPDMDADWKSRTTNLFAVDAIWC